MRPHLSRAARAAVRGTAVLLAAGSLLAAGGAAAQGAPERTWADRPERGIGLHAEYSRVTIPVGETLRMDLTVENRGRRDENVMLKLAAVPGGWKAAIKSGQFTVGGVPVTPDKPRTLTFSADPDDKLGPGTYTFRIEGAAADGSLPVSQTIVVTTEARSATEGGDLQITTSYPVLRGPTDSSFEFSLEVSNKADADRVVNVAAEAPRGWEVTLKPAYESKQITSLRVRGGASQTVALELKPPADARAGEYPVVFRASADRAQADARLTVVLTGVYKLDATTPTGRLSMDAVVGKPAVTNVIVRNTGSALNRNIRLSAFAPESWKVEFAPEKIEALEPGAFRTVDVKVTPSAEALVGDYSVSVTADGERASKTLELRVTAHASPAWGWIGVGVIALVIGGLGGLFTWLGRR